MKVNPSSSNEIEIYITPTRVHIYNPGSLVSGTDPQIFANGIQGSMIRNPLIATVLYYNRTIDAFGTGFERVFRLCGENGYRYSNNSFGFTFEFIRSKELKGESINDSITGTLTKTEKAVFEILDGRQKYSKSEIAAKISKSPATVQRAIKKMIEKGIIKRVGSNKTGYWVVIK